MHHRRDKKQREWLICSTVHRSGKQRCPNTKQLSVELAEKAVMTAFDEALAGKIVMTELEAVLERQRAAQRDPAPLQAEARPDGQKSGTLRVSTLVSWSDGWVRQRGSDAAALERSRAIALADFCASRTRRVPRSGRAVSRAARGGATVCAPQTMTAETLESVPETSFERPNPRTCNPACAPRQAFPSGQQVLISDLEKPHWRLLIHAY